MNRRQFMKASGSVIIGSTMLPKRGLSKKGESALKAINVHNYLRSLCDVSEPSCDRFIIGDPDTKVTKIGTCWLPYWKTLRRAVEQGINTLVVHEPTFYTHWDLDEKDKDYWQAPEAAKNAYLKLIDKKKEWIQKNGLVIIRCHDVLDKVPEFGMRSLNARLKEEFPEHDIIHLDQGCSYRWVTSQ